MQLLKCSLAVTLLLTLCHICQAMPGVRVKRQDDLINLEDEKDSDLNPINAEDVANDDLERNKRKLPDATFEAKNAILGFVFGLANIMPNRLVRATVTKDYGDDASVFDRQMVELDFPPDLFAKTSTSVMDISKVFSSLITNSARRYSRFAILLKPVFGDSLTVKGNESPTAKKTTTTTTRTANTTPASTITTTTQRLNMNKTK